MESNKIVNRLKVLIALPFIVLLFVFFVMINQFYNKINILDKVNLDIKTIKILSQTMTQLQKERGLSCGYIESKSVKLHKKIVQQRLLTDEMIEKVHRLYSSNIKVKQAINVSSLRNQVDADTILSSDVFGQYTSSIQTLFNQYIFITTNMKNDTITKEFAPFTSLLVMQESLSRLRESFNAIFSKNRFDKKLYYIAVHAKGQYDIAERRYTTIAPHNFKINLEKIHANKNYILINKCVQKYLLNRSNAIKENTENWFEINTNIISLFINLREMHLHSIQKEIQTLYSDYKEKIVLNITIFFIVTFFMLFLGIKIKKSILEKIFLLHQYKDIVDRSSIVSKTDTYGRITYVNDKFCSISGYTKEELLGKAHNIVRHKDMPKSAFKEMWDTIQAKKIWQGVVKNRKKDGSSYTVEATISPILDAGNNIVEYMALRNDITEIINLHEEIEQTQEEMILKIGEIGETRSRETGNHVKRVAKYSEVLAKGYGLDEEEVKNITLASSMHDIGKVAIPDSILNKPGKLTQEEWKVMQKHAEIGYELFRNSKRTLLKTAAIIANEHHEKYNGSGYPQGLKGENIHIYGRITALADVFDALGSDRCYKKAWDDEKILKLIKEESGEHFDPKLVDIFFEHLDEFIELRNTYSDKSDFMEEEV